MAKVTLYLTAHCPFCVSARELLTRKKVVFDEIRVDQDAEQRAIMMEKSGRRTVPQIFINDKPIGGFDDLAALDASGELDTLLSQ